MSTEDLRNAALLNALSSIRENARFPYKVFSGAWKGFLFFDPIRLFTACFIEVKNLLLDEEKASIIALINLGNVIHQRRALFLDRSTQSQEYISTLMTTKSPGSTFSWMVLVDRYVCASDRGYWSIYCEKENDIAAFAFQEGLSDSTRLAVAALLKAKALGAVEDLQDRESFAFNRLVPFWKAALLAEYSSE
jgi:hypothetical protein